MNQLKEQIISLTVDLQDKERANELLQKKLAAERNNTASYEESLFDKYDRLIKVRDLLHNCT